MFEEVIDAQTARVLRRIAGSAIARDFYLAGGTALAIQLGHRTSVDLDWFSSGTFSNDAIKAELAGIGAFSLTGEDKGTIHGVLDEVKVSFLEYRHRLLFPLVDFAGVRLADERDIAGMKLSAVSSRGSRKDFFDIYFLLEKYSLSELVGFFEEKYRGVNYNKLHIMKSLMFFADAEKEPMPIMRKPVTWEEVKEKIMRETKAFLES